LNNHSQPPKPSVIADDVVVRMDYTLSVDGEVFETSTKSEPIEFIQGYGQIIPGLERELYGLMPGQSKEVFVASNDAYGDLDPDAMMDVPRSEFGADIPLEPGVEVQVKNEDGEVMDARISKVQGDTVELDFNHPLAGKDLVFDVKIVDLRDATPEELEHGHVHGDVGHDHELQDKDEIEE